EGRIELDLCRIFGLQRLNDGVDGLQHSEREVGAAVVAGADFEDEEIGFLDIGTGGDDLELGFNLGKLRALAVLVLADALALAGGRRESAELFDQAVKAFLA